MKERRKAGSASRELSQPIKDDGQEFFLSAADCRQTMFSLYLEFEGITLILKLEFMTYRKFIPALPAASDTGITRPLS